jgi:hypothetical protein
MGQQPNIELELSDLPRPTAKVGVSRRWTPNRPGDITTPEQMPTGPGFGRPGPDTGFVLKLIDNAEFVVADDESHHNVEYALALIAGARASRYMRGPTVEDVEVALTVAGYRGNDAGAMADARKAAFANVSHDNARARVLIDAIPESVLLETPAQIATRMQAGERFLPV